MSSYEETVWRAQPGRGAGRAGLKHHELQSIGRLLYRELRDFLNSKRILQGYSNQTRSAAWVPSLGY
jgi:hypothetical protein